MKKILTLILLFLIVGCDRSVLEFHNQDQSLFLNIENDGNEIKWDESFKVNLKYKNIGIDGLSIEGPVPKTKAISDNEIELEMFCPKNMASKEDIKANSVKLKIGFLNIDNEAIFHTFIIPIH